ncbi:MULTISPECIES: hypothetical protein [Halorubrum]|uniref:Uncharacterized protein n=1 Tax=Halorubrum hochstenium ATCC 700873 TaxID=1227481 RepID=M0FF22_9EURY|nr:MULTISPECIES: hypothetical protein [Halorubrum]ELZ57224.1 hypothetical protein C467_07365 [Halorubrum hochstenium ATCC 700873]
MSRDGTWSFPTATGGVEVAPDEIRVRRRLRPAADHAGRALANGRLGALTDAFGWAGVGALFTVLSAVPRLLSVGDGSEALWVGGIAAVTVIGTLAASVGENRRETIPLRAVERVEFDGDGIVVVHEPDDADDSAGGLAKTEIRPRSDDARADAALALRLRGVDIRGVDGDDAVSRTAVDAPKTELLE